MTSNGVKKILFVTDKKENEFLRRTSLPMELSKERRRELRELVRKMKVAMKEAIGIGLSANQIGREERLFVAQIDKKFYAVINPKITKSYGEKIKAEEGVGKSYFRRSQHSGEEDKNQSLGTFGAGFSA
jgi:peptide deformylase